MTARRTSTLRPVDRAAMAVEPGPGRRAHAASRRLGADLAAAARSELGQDSAPASVRERVRQARLLRDGGLHGRALRAAALSHDGRVPSGAGPQGRAREPLAAAAPPPRRGFLRSQASFCRTGGRRRRPDPGKVPWKAPRRSAIPSPCALALAWERLLAIETFESPRIGRTSRSGPSACRARSSSRRPRSGSTSRSRRARYPDRAAYLFFGRALELPRSCATRPIALAGWLQRVGVEKGDRVAVFMQNCPQFPTALYGVLRADAVVVPVNPMNREEEFKHYISDPGTRVVICSADLAEIVAKANAALPESERRRAISSRATATRCRAGAIDAGRHAAARDGGLAARRPRRCRRATCAGTTRSPSSSCPARTPPSPTTSPCCPTPPARPACRRAACTRIAR